MDELSGGKRLLMPAVETSGRIIVIGAVMADTVCHVPAVPAPGEGVVVTERSVAVGGCAFNTVNAIRHVGGDAALFAPIGRGLCASYISEELAARGMPLLRVDTDIDNGMCTVLVTPDGERTMVTSPGIERRFEPSWFDGIGASRFAIGIATGYEIEGPGGDAIIGFFEDHPEIAFWYAPGPRIGGVSAEKTARINALHPVWHLNDQEACSYTGESTVEAAARAIMAQTASPVIVTEGSRGAAVFDGEERTFVAAHPVDAVDTIGAGDSHIGVIAACRAAGLPWQTALERANAYASEVCRTSGVTIDDARFAEVFPGGLRVR